MQPKGSSDTARNRITTRRHSSTHKQATDNPALRRGFFSPPRRAPRPHRKWHYRAMSPTAQDRWRSRALGVQLGGAALLGGRAPADEPAAPGLHEQLAFSGYSPLAATHELVRRLLTPLAAAEVQRR